ncbi:MULTISPECIES: 3-dehydroquinate synthase [unclassified Luteococcus]|uniref:3-dehydroquinate synthase n=1 Tax=unclassified Luteococcus TaxID=2639923 RepID=UPI00313E8A82
MATLQVNAEQPYQVQIGNGVVERVGELASGAARAAIIHQPVLSDQAERVALLLRQAGLEPVTIEVPAGEPAKTGQVLQRCWDDLAAAGMTRSDVVIGIGGGAATDLAGFVAATWLRGVGYLSIPTTVLAMVDAAVGGKTGINIAAGKNLVGAFHEPRGVLCDLDLLIGLPTAEVVSGLAEVVKCGFIADPRILELVEQDPTESVDVSTVRFAELVRRAVSVKAEVVSGDLREATSTADRVGREALNYGHTLGHAIEQFQHFTWRHGEAVAIGMVFAAEVAARTVGLPAQVVARHRSVLSSIGLPTVYNAGEWSTLRATMSLDKKARGNTLRLVGLRQVGEVTIIDGPDEDLLREAWTTLDPH